MILVLLLLSLPVGHAALTLTANPEYVDETTSEVTLTCSADGTGNMERVLDLVTEKRILTGDWKALAHVYSGQKQPEGIDPNVTTTGLIATSTDQTSQLKVKIQGKGAQGEYRCTAIGFSYLESFISEHAYTEVTLGGYRARLADIEARLAKAEDTMANQEVHAQVNWDAKTIAAMDGEDLFKLLIWPSGTYTLLQPETGCPHPGFSFVGWKSTGFRQFHTESTSPENLDEVSPGCHLKQPIQAQNGDKHFMYLYFCVDDNAIGKGPEWPRGSYCFIEYGSCPDGFHEGNIQWDDENTQHENVYAGPSVNGEFNANTLINFCCRRDGAPEDPMLLPISKPFYLFRFGGECQQVTGANVTNEYLVFDTENAGNNIDKYSNDYHPDGELDNIRIELCYYERSD